MKAGFDISLNGSGIAFEDDRFYFQTSLVKLPKKLTEGNITGYTIAKRKDGITLKYKTNAEDIIKECIHRGITEVAMEGYAYGYGSNNSPGMVFDIAEFSGIVKYLLMVNDIKLTIIPPKKIKKNATKNGNASKVLMVEEYLKRCPKSALIDFIDTYHLNKYKSPINDLVDAWFALQMIL